MSKEDVLNEDTFNYLHGYANQLLFPKALSYLANKYRSSAHMIAFFDDKIAQSAFYFVAKYDFEQLENDCYVEYELAGFDRFLANLIIYFSEIRNQLDFTEQEQDILDAEWARELAERHTLCLRYALFLIKTNAMMVNPSFCKNFCLNDGLKGLLALLSDKAFVEKHVSTEFVMWESDKILLLEYTLMDVVNLSMYCEDVKQKWTELDAVITLKFLSRKIPSCSYYCLTAITNLADDWQIEKLEEVNVYRGMIVDRLQHVAASFDANTVKQQNRIIFENNQMVSVDIACITESNGTTTSLFTILHGLYKLAINNKMKHELYFDLNCKQYMKSIILAGRECETKYTLRYGSA
jgi:hypothetical protein